MMATAEHPTMVHLMADQTITDHPTRILQALQIRHQNAVKTGDAANVAGVAGVAILCLATGIVVVLIKRKRIR